MNSTNAGPPFWPGVASHFREQTEETEMIDLYYWPTPNGHKITMFLQEAGVDCVSRLI
jgi:hypothetical protein